MKVLIGLAALVAAVTTAGAAGVTISHLFNLSDFSGTLPYSGGRLVADPGTEELYVIASNEVRVFNAWGMEIYRFGLEPELGQIRDLAIDENGDILTLSHDLPPARGYHIARCDYRGRVKAAIEPTDLSDEFAAVRPDRIFLRPGGLYLASRLDKRAAVIDSQNGEFRRDFDLAELLELSAEQRADENIVGFDMDRQGNMLVTIPTMFRAFVVSPSGKMNSFGEGGSTAGSFGVVSGITRNDDGHFFVADRGRSVVMVFNERFEFVSEFGYRGTGPENLVRPDSLAVTGSDKVYVTQMRQRGVAAFSVSYE